MRMGTQPPHQHTHHCPPLRIIQLDVHVLREQRRVEFGRPQRDMFLVVQQRNLIFLRGGGAFAEAGDAAIGIDGAARVDDADACSAR